MIPWLNHWFFSSKVCLFGFVQKNHNSCFWPHGDLPIPGPRRLSESHHEIDLEILDLMWPSKYLPVEHISDRDTGTRNLKNPTQFPALLHDRLNSPHVIPYAKLIVNFSHESDVTSLDPFLFYYCVPHKIRRGILLITNADIRHLLDSLVSALAVYATAFRSRLSLPSMRVTSDF